MHFERPGTSSVQHLRISPSTSRKQTVRLMCVDGLEVRVFRKPIRNLNLRVKPAPAEENLGQNLRVKPAPAEESCGQAHFAKPPCAEESCGQKYPGRALGATHATGSCRIEVSVPLDVDDDTIVSFIRNKRVWIDRHIAAVASSPNILAENATPFDLDRWKEDVSSLVPPLIAKWEEVLGVKAGCVAYRNMKSRWGSCNPQTGRICINIRLALYPPECLEYVVVHELCHLRERGHGSRFKQLMDRALPDWRVRRALLR